MTIDVLFSNRINKDTLAVEIEGSICIVIDIIRATSTISTILARGSTDVVVAKDKAQALALKKENSDFLLCGEEGGLPPAGFDYGNSPLELSGINMSGKTAILKTTNGTVSMYGVKNAAEVYCLSLLNLDYTISLVSKKIKKTGQDLLFVCSGEGGRVAYDDVFAAGLGIKGLLAKGLKCSYSDSSKVALGSAMAENNIVDALEKSTSARLLRGVGLGEDIGFCAQLNKYNTGAKLQQGASNLRIIPC